MGQTISDALVRGIRMGFRQALEDMEREEPQGDHPIIARWKWRQNDKAQQALWNNLYSNNPGELDRWADDGGQCPWR